MKLSRSEILENFNLWLIAWDNYDLETVLKYMHEDIVFEGWDGTVVTGKKTLQAIWTPWFIFNGNFKFISEDISIDEQNQKMTFLWRLEWPSIEKDFKGKPEVRRGLDVLHFLDGKINKKYSYSKTSIEIEDRIVLLHASKNEI